ncbi:MAG TPA: glutathione S-transferase family protein [Caulobacteraceae bacterium]
MAEEEIVLHYSVASRSLTALWMLEELGLVYRLVDRDLRTTKNRSPDYLRLNPMGTVPTLVVGEVVVSENPAICLYLADRYGYGSLAPRIEEADRGAYLKWMVYSTAVLEPAVALAGATLDYGAKGPPRNWGPNWGDADDVVRVLTQALEGRDYLLGSRFSAADVMLGSSLGMRLFTGMLPAAPVLVAYNERLEARPARQRAGAITWPASLFPAA